MSSPDVEILKRGRAALNAQAASPNTSASSKTPLFNLTAEQQQNVDKLLRAHGRNARRLGRIYKKCATGKFKHERAKFLSSFCGRMCATIETFAQQEKPADFATLMSFAKTIDVWEPTAEKICVHVIAKDDGGYRFIQKDGPRRMAARFLVRDCLLALGLDNEFDFCRPGAGGERALVQHVCNSVAAGVSHWAAADIKHFYPSLRPAHLDWLPLPKTIIRNVVFLPKWAKFQISQEAGTEASSAPAITSVDLGGVNEPSVPNMALSQEAMKQVRLGLSTGSVLSPLVARAFVGRHLREVLGDGVVAGAFVDNLVWGASTRSFAFTARDEFENRLKKLPAGPIFLHDHRYANAKHTYVPVLGYKLTLGRGFDGNPVHVCPGRRRFARYHRRNFERWKTAAYPNVNDFAHDRAERWMPSQSAWTGVPNFSFELLWTSTTIALGDLLATNATSI